MPQSKTANKKTKKTKSKFKIPFSYKPIDLSVEEWQTALRQQVARETLFEIIPTGNDVYGDYWVTNVHGKNKYRVAIRSKTIGKNFCTCLDFKTNRLGTCKHIEAVFNWINKKPKLKKLLKVEPIQSYSSIYIDYNKEQKLRLRLGTEETIKLKKLFKPFINENDVLVDSFLLQADKIIPKAIKMESGFKCYEDVLEKIVQYREEKKRFDFISNIRGNNLPKVPSLKVKLFPYQKAGVRFIVKAGRSILADDMGLGKTIQAIAASQALYEHFGVLNILIICPTSLKYQWQNEINKFTKSKALVVEGQPIQRKVQYAAADFLYKIVSYNTASNDISIINEVKPDFIILDEAQRIKNWQTKLSANIKKLKSDYKLVLTGTPIENRIQDLYSLIQFIRPTDLESLYNFSSKYETKDINGKVIGYKNLNEIAEFVKPFLLRRTKKEVLHEMPLRTDKNIFVSLTPEQREWHDTYIEKIAKLIARWKQTRFLKEEDRLRLMTFLGNMRMLCNSTFILDLQTNYQTKIDELFNVLELIWETSDEKVVIFSQWERFTRLIASVLDQKKIGYANLHGQIASKNRKALFDRFNNDTDCMVFLSTDAGGVGLNLQAGSYVINMDMPWNPAVLEQRIARVYRFGQSKNVSVINFVAENTIEHGMLSRLKFKSALAAGILDNGEPNIFMDEEQSKSFMESVTDLFDTDPLKKSVYNLDVVEDVNDEIFNTSTNESEIIQSDLDNILEESSVEEITNVEKNLGLQQTIPFPSEPSATTTDSNEFLAQANNFLSSFSAILSDAKATENLINTISKKDEKTGKTYIQIPVENEGVVKNLIGFLAGIMKG